MVCSISKQLGALRDHCYECGVAGQQCRSTSGARLWARPAFHSGTGVRSPQLLLRRPTRPRHGGTAATGSAPLHSLHSESTLSLTSPARRQAGRGLRGRRAGPSPPRGQGLLIMTWLPLDIAADWLATAQLRCAVHRNRFPCPCSAASGVRRRQLSACSDRRFALGIMPPPSCRVAPRGTKRRRRPGRRARNAPGRRRVHCRHAVNARPPGRSPPPPPPPPPPPRRHRSAPPAVRRRRRAHGRRC